jgi:DMSO reductase anchor subunit
MSTNWDESRTYHGAHVIQDPVWTWEIPCYFFTGGMGGAAAGLAFLAGVRGNEVLAKRSWGVAMAAIGVSPVLLTSDLGRPMRFINMFRMFKVTSPMSVGSWLLGASGALTTVAAANAYTGMFPRLARLARPGAALAGLPLSTYTAALISNTAVPAWHEAHKTLPFVFGSGAALSAGAAAVAVTPPEHSRPARRLALGAAALEVLVKEAMERQLGDHSEAYKQGMPAQFSHVAQACITTGATLLFRRGGNSRKAAAISGALLCAGALAARWSVFKAGFRSAQDPKYVVGPQRQRIEQGRSAGASRRTPSIESPDPALGSPGTVVREQTPTA